MVTLAATIAYASFIPSDTRAAAMPDGPSGAGPSAANAEEASRFVTSFAEEEET